LIVEILKNLKLDAISEDDLPRLGETIGSVAQIMLGVDENHRRAIQGQQPSRTPRPWAKRDPSGPP
jgi:hypothetical protein